MLQTSIIVELLRSQPRLTFWFMALTQTVLWWVFPSLFFSSPPGDLPVVLAVGHEYQLGSYFGPPLAFWLADIAYRRRRRHRGLPAGAGLRARHAVGGVHARARRGRHSSRRLRGAADGRHLGVLRADAEFRPAGAGDAARRAVASEPVARGRRAAPGVVVRARPRARPAHSHDLCRPHPARADHRVPGGDAARPQRDALGGAVARERPHRRRAVPAPDVARPLERPRHARLAAAAGRGRAGRGPQGLGRPASRRSSSPISGS